MNVKITAPYPRFRIDHMKFNVSSQRYCSENDIKILKKVDPNFAIFKHSDGIEINPMPKPKKKTIKKEAPDVLKNKNNKQN